MRKKTPRKPGRPALPPSRVKRVVPIRLTTAEHRKYKEEAKTEGLSLSEWVRRTLLLATDNF